MAKIYKTTGGEETVTPQNGKHFSLKELKKIVGGYIENVYLNNGDIMIVNEEGKLDGLPLNIKATAIFRKNFPDSEDTIVGDILITEQKYVE
jgi:hypothetical protein